MEHYGDHRRGTNLTTSVNPVYEDIEPSSGWIEDAENHYLLIDLPGIHTSLFPRFCFSKKRSAFQLSFRL